MSNKDHKEPIQIAIQFKDKDGVFLMSMLFNYPSERYLLQAFERAYPLLANGMLTSEVLVNLCKLNLAGVKVEEGVIHNPSRLRSEHYEDTGN